MDTFITREGNILVDSQGRFLIPATIPALVFPFASTEFPPTGHAERFIQFNTKSLPQTIFIDFMDESPIFEEDFTSLIWSTSKYQQSNNTAKVVRVFPDASSKKAKIWFRYPEKITVLTTASLTFEGEFPLNIGLYNLSALNLSSTNFDTFPVQLSGGIFSTLTLYAITKNTVNSIPKWIYSSRVDALSLTGGFDFSNLAISNLDKLINVLGLRELYLNSLTPAYNVNAASIPDNLKDIGTLRVLSLGSAQITEIPPQLNNCKQIFRLDMGYSTGRNNGARTPMLVSWGVGVANMPNLTTFTAAACENIPTELVTGIETSGVNRYETLGSYKTVARVDDSLMNALTKVAAVASKTVGNTVLRNITWTNNSAGSLTNAAPTGVFEAPPNFILGSSNGDIQNAMQAVYVLCKQYRWTITVNIPGTFKTYNYLS